MKILAAVTSMSSCKARVCLIPISVCLNVLPRNLGTFWKTASVVLESGLLGGTTGCTHFAWRTFTWIPRNTKGSAVMVSVSQVLLGKDQYFPQARFFAPWVKKAACPALRYEQDAACTQSKGTVPWLQEGGCAFWCLQTPWFVPTVR